MLSNILTKYTSNELEAAVSNYLLQKYRTPEAIVKLFKAYIQDRINALVKPKILSSSELEDLALKHCIKICEKIPSDEAEISLHVRKLFTEEFKKTCREGVILNDEVKQVDKVIREYLSPLVKKHFGVISGNQRDLRKQLMPTKRR